MLKELFESIVSQAHKSVLPEQPQLFEPLVAPDFREVCFVHGGELQFKTLPLPPRSHTASSAADLVAIVAAFGSPPEPSGDDRPINESKEISTVRNLSTATLFVGNEFVVAILDAARRERVRLELTRSVHFKTLEQLPRSFSQKDAIAFLRRSFSGTGLDKYVTNLRQVVFERQQVGAGVSQRNTESMGRSVEAKVTGTQDLPEFLRGEISVYDPAVFNAPWSVEVGVDPRLTDEQFDFWMPPDALSLGLLSAQLQLVEYLREHLPGATVVRGNE
jgi:hypothetical protein